MLTVHQATNDFLTHCQYEKNLSEKTLRAYGIDLKQFIRFVEGTIAIDLIDREMIKKYLKLLAVRKPKTIKRKIASLKALFNFLEFEDRITVSPFRKIKINIKESKVLPVVMTLGEVKAILDFTHNTLNAICNKKSYGYHEKLRDVIVLELLFATGIRVAELCNLRIEHVDLKSMQIVVNGKGNRQRIIQICDPEVLKLLSLYNNACIKRRTRTSYFFTNRFKNRLSEQSVRNLVHRIIKSVRLTKRVTPHTFRHTVATLLLEQNVDIKFIQNILGHSSILTTQIYTHVSNNKQREILTSKHPRRQLQLIPGI